MSASNAILVDTNVLVYAHDPRDEGKRQRAIVVLDKLIPTGRAVLSVQCLSEFFRVTTVRLRSLFSATKRSRRWSVSRVLVASSTSRRTSCSRGAGERPSITCPFGTP